MPETRGPANGPALPSTAQRYVSPELTHFVGRRHRRAPDAEERQYADLVEILRAGRLVADPNPAGKEPAQGLATLDHEREIHLSGGRAWLPAAVSFCDIPLADMGLHIDKYSPFGLAFAKRFLVPRGASPVFYVPLNAPGTGDLRKGEHFDRMVHESSRIFDELERHLPRDAPGLGERVRALREWVERHVIAYLLPFDDAAPDTAPDNLYMEREWRVLGDLTFALGDVSRIVLPAAFARRLRDDVPDYAGQVAFRESLAG